MSTKDKSAAVKEQPVKDKESETVSAALDIPYAMVWPEMKICLAPQMGWETLEPDKQKKVRAEYGDGLVILDWIQARRVDLANLLVFERRTWDKIPKDIQKKLQETYVQNDGLWIFADDFLTLIDTKRYSTTQRGNALAFCKIRGWAYMHTADPAAGYHWEWLEKDKDGHIGGYWRRDKNDTWLREQLNQLTDKMWAMVLSIPVSDDNSKKKGQDTETPKDDDKMKWELRIETLKKWRAIIRDRYESLANYELDKVLARIKAEKDKEGVTMNDPDKCAGILPCLNGIYELATGTFRSAKKEDWVSYYLPTMYDPDAFDQKVRDALDLFFDKDKDKDRAKNIEDYFWELVGTGLYPVLRKDTKAMVQLIGTRTNNGKTTLVRALMATLGDADGTGLAQSVRPEAFAKIAGANTSTLTPDFATISWARLVFVSEPDENLRINWAQVKDLTGGGMMKVNPKNEAMYKIPAQFSMYWDTNYFLRVDDPTIFSRGTMRLIPFEHTFKEADRDPEIDHNLSKPTARSYFLNLMIEGLRRYLSKGGFSAPEVCQKMVKDYEQSSDKLGEFLAQNYIKTNKSADKIMLKKEAYPRYIEWCSENGYKGVESYAEFVRKLKNRPGIVIGSRNNAQTLDGYIRPEPIKIDLFNNMDPLDWYLRNYTAQNPLQETKSHDDSEDEDIEPAQTTMDGAEEPLTSPVPPLTLEALRKDYAHRVFEKDKSRQTLDTYALFVELLRRKWEITPEAGDLGQSTIKSHHVMTKEELEDRELEGRRKQFKSLQDGIGPRLKTISNKQDLEAIQHLMKSGALSTFLKTIPNAYANIFRAVILDGDPLEVAIGREADRLCEDENQN